MADKIDVSVYTGPYSTTTHVKHLITTESGDAVPTELVRAININDDPKLFDELVAGTLHNVAGPDGASYELAVPVVVHDAVRHVLALIIPEALRWDESRLRKELIDEIALSGGPVPSYARHFHAMIGPAGFEALQGASDVLGEEEVTQIASRPTSDLIAGQELAKKRAELEAEAERIRVEREQLDEVRERFDRERDQLDQLAEQITAGRQELDQLHKAIELERQQLQVQRLNEEAEALKAQSGESSTKEEATQVVTDDQFVEIVDVSDIELAAAESVVKLDVDEVVIAEITAADVPDNMSELVSSARQSAVKIIKDRVLAMAQLDRDKVDKIFEGDPTFFVQLHEIDGYPVVGLLLATLDERDQIVEGFSWPLDPAPDGDRLVLDKLRNRTKLRAAFYGPTGARLKAVEIAAPFSANVAWILERSNELLKKPGRVKYPEAREKFESDLPKLGTMRHNFTKTSFADMTSTSDVKLAAGIVGYWSKSDTFQYLIANRCFPLEHFRSIQQRVTRRAAEAGIFINRPLRTVALSMDIASDERALVEVLIANFAETSISIRSNDLEPADQWDNWDALLGLGEELGLPPDPDVVELAEVSLKRAQEAEELAERQPSPMVAKTIEEPRPPNTHEALVVAKRSESTGITYFLPNDAVLDTFDDLASMSRTDLELLLNDANGRLEAAQMLIERFGASAASKALETAEKMNAPEVAALALFIESKAGGLEAELVRCVESGGPSVTYVAARGLAAVKSTSAIPALIEALQDPDRTGDPVRFAEAIAEYGEKVMPALTRAIKRDGANDQLVQLLSALEDRESGTLSSLSKDRSKNLREAARLARQQRESQSA